MYATWRTSNGNRRLMVVPAVLTCMACKNSASPRNVVALSALEGNTHTRSTSLVVSQIPRANDPEGLSTGRGPRARPNTGEK